jgi:hypothetical protein
MKMYVYEKLKKERMENTTYRKDNFIGLHILNYYLLIIFAALDSFPYTLSPQMCR